MNGAAADAAIVLRHPERSERSLASGAPIARQPYNAIDGVRRFRIWAFGTINFVGAGLFTIFIRIGPTGGVGDTARATNVVQTTTIVTNQGFFLETDFIVPIAMACWLARSYARL